MRTRWAAVLVVAAALAGIWWLTWRQPPAEQTLAGPLRGGVELTVYADDFALVRERRPLRLEKGANRLEVAAVSRQLDPQSVLLRWAGAPGLPEPTGHTYDLGVRSGEDLLKRYLGKPVELVRYGENGREADRRQGTLMVENGGEVVVEADGRFLVRPQGEIAAPVAADVVTIPQLTVQAESPSARSADLEMVYLTRGLAWSADYVATVAPTSGTVALDLMATVTNRTGADYPAAKVSLMAGAPNRAVVAAEAKAEWPSGAMAKAPARPEMDAAGRRLPAGPPEAVGDLQKYDIAHPTTIAQEQMNRLRILSSDRVPAQMDYSARPPQLSPWGVFEGGWGTVRRPARGGVAVAMTLFNRARDGLGVPLPHGAIRVYEPDASGALRYAGAAEVQDTPVDQKVTVALARAFDVFTEWRLVRSQRIDRRTVRKQVEVVLHNGKPAPLKLRVVQGFLGRWKVTHESGAHARLNASEAQWTAAVPARGETRLSYTVDLAE